MKREIVQRPRARADMIEIHANIGRYNPRKADRFFKAVDSILDLIASYPEMGASVPSSNLSTGGLRRAIPKGFREYLIFYVPSDRTIEVVRVLHGSRDLDSILGKE